MNDIHREKIIKDLKNQLKRIFSYVKTDEDFFASIIIEYNKNQGKYKSLEHCYEQTMNSYKKIVEHEVDTYCNVDTLLLEQKIWSFVENNPEQWYLMIEKIALNDQCANIFTPSGFCFVNSFINHIIYNKGALGCAQKDQEALFFNIDNTEDKKYYINAGYNINTLKQQQISALLDTLKNQVNK